MTSQEPRVVHSFVGGEWVGDPTVDRYNPAATDQVVVRTPRADERTVREAVSAAQDAAGPWAAMPSTARGTILTDAAEILRSRHREIATDMVREEGKVFADAMGEVRRAIDVFRYFGSMGWQPNGITAPSATPYTHLYTKREPLGVVAAITPWNFPIAIPAWKIAPALVSGNAVVLKPAELTPMSSWHLVRALDEAGLPKGVLNLLLGSGSAVGNQLTADDRVAAVSFTGSVQVGAQIRAALDARGGRVQLEMGGKNPLVVLDDADVSVAARLAALGAFGQTGQVCTATSRIICTPGIHDQLVTELVKAAAEFRPQNGLAEGARMGPVVTSTQLEQDREYIDVATGEGAELVSGGELIEDQMLSPAVLTGVQPHHRIAQEEVFGPVAAVLTVADLDEAIEVSNSVEMGLAAGIITNDIRAAHRFIDAVQAGVVKVNRPTSGLDLTVPFGGVKASSTDTYREQGTTAADFYTSTKTIYLGFDPS